MVFTQTIPSHAIPPRLAHSWLTTHPSFERNYGFCKGIELVIKFLTPYPFNLKKSALGF